MKKFVSVLCLYVITTLILISCKSSEVTPTSNATVSVTDIDGNVYNTVTIGSQTWMQSNLKVSKYNDGNAIPLVTDAIEWYYLTTSGYSYYDNSTLTGVTYGALYNWYTVNTSKLCPTGWHVPSTTEWTTLSTFLGGSSVGGGKLKDTGTNYWKSPNSGATNETGFTALPGGYRHEAGLCLSIGSNGMWWSSTEANTTSAWYRSIGNNLGFISGSSNSKQGGLSVRCLRD